VEQNDNRWLLGFGLLGCMVVMCALAIGGSMLLYRASSLAGAGASRTTVADAVEAMTEPFTGQSAQAPAGALAPRAATPPPALEVLPLAGVVGSGAADLTRLYQQVNPGVVSLGVIQETEINGQTFRQLGGGSGFVFDDRHIVTNNHVAGSVESVEVIFHDGQHRQGTVVGADAYSDLAVIRVDDLPAGVRALPLVGNFDSLKVGQPVIAIGSPFGRANSMTYGIISALGRTIPAGLEAGFSIPQTIQTDAAINPGNSGGPLVNLDGEVVGVNFAIESETRQNSGVGFTIPVSILKRVVPALIEEGAYKYAYLGLEGSTISPQLAEALELPDNTLGVYVSSVVPGGPSEQGGVQGGSRTVTTSSGAEVQQGGDIVTAIDDMPVVRFEDLVSYLVTKATPGQTVTLTVDRNGEEVKVEVTLGERPSQSVATTESGPDGAISARAAIAIAEDTVRNELTGEITEKVATPQERDGQSVWVVELNTATQTATVVINAESGDVIEVAIE
jgi:2-alkenal reductase